MPSIAVKRKYEAIYILDSGSTEEQITAITGKYKQIVETAGGTVENIDIWENRKLAYEIKGRTDGRYVVMNFTSEANAEKELRRIFQISEDQIRYMIVKPEEIDEPGAARQPRGESAASVPAPVAAPAPVAPAAPIAEAAPVVEAASVVEAEAVAAPVAETAPAAETTEEAAAAA
jgi:small subunit ribosomal protein S6